MRLISLIVVFSIALFTLQANAQPAAKAPELKVLEKFAGTWTTASRHSIGGDGAERDVTGEVKVGWILDGQHMQGNGKDTEMEYQITFGYDANKHAYRTWFMESRGGATEWTGSWDESSSTLTIKHTDGPYTGTLTAKFVGDKIEWAGSGKDGDGNVFWKLTGTWTKKK